MGHCLWDWLTDYRANVDQFYAPSYSNMMRWNRCLHTVWFLHLTDNRNEVDRTEQNCDRLCKLWAVFEIVNTAFSKFCSPLENLAIDRGIVLFPKEGWFSGKVFLSRNVCYRTTQVVRQDLIHLWHETQDSETETGRHSNKDHHRNEFSTVNRGTW
jgi:hypothetical protein